MKREKLIITVLAIVVIVLVIAAFGYIYYSKYLSHPKRNGEFGNFSSQRNLQLNESQTLEVKQFFDGTTDIAEINSYCQNNRMNCFYYCRTINPNHEICREMMNESRRGPSQRPDMGAPSQ